MTGKLNWKKGLPSKPKTGQIYIIRSELIWSSPRLFLVYKDQYRTWPEDNQYYGFVDIDTDQVEHVLVDRVKDD